MMKKDTIKELQESPDYVILRNPLASPKFVRMIGANKSIEVTDIYTPKIFYEIASRLTPEHLVNIKRNESIIMDLSIKDFLESIGANSKNYKYLIDSIKILQNSSLEWRDEELSGDITTSVITKSIHYYKSGKVELFIDSDIARKILEIQEDGNFSFLKNNVFRLQNAQAIRLYPFFKSWLNFGRYSTDLVRFKDKFGYNTSGYRFWNNFEERVLKPATEEINEKTDIYITYEPTGESLESQRPRIKGLNFRINKKDDIKILSEASPTPGEPHIDTAPQPRLFEKDEQVEELFVLLKKIKIQEEPTELTAKALIESLISGIGYQGVKDGLLGMIDSKAKPKTIAFFTSENLLKYPGFEQSQKEQEERKRENREREQEKLTKQRTIEELKKIYQTQRSEYLKKVYSDLDEEVKTKEITELWESSGAKVVYFRNQNKEEPNIFAVTRIAEKYAFPGGYDEKKHIKHFALKNFNLQIDHDEKGEIVIN